MYLKNDWCSTQVYCMTVKHLQLDPLSLCSSLSADQQRIATSGAGAVLFYISWLWQIKNYDCFSVNLEN